MKKNIYHLLFVSFAIILSGCNTSIDVTYENADKMVEDAKASVSTISAGEFKALLDEHAEISIIDCREPDEFIKGHIPGAINIPRGVLEFSNKISKRRVKLFIYSQTENRASLACVTLQKLKYSDVTLINGGWEEWNKTYPEMIEEGSGTQSKEAPAKEEESGGCGG